MYAECPGCVAPADGGTEAAAGAAVGAAAGTTEVLEGNCAEGTGADDLLKGIAAAAAAAAGGAAVLAAASVDANSGGVAA